MPRKRTKRLDSSGKKSRGPKLLPTQLRIIGGRFRNQKLTYGGDPITRPMKERVREAVFNLIGPSIKGRYAIDPFAGTGALALEAISRGAIGATLVERHFPTTRLIRQNVQYLGIEDLITIESQDAFFWARHLPDFENRPLVIFCSPPYSLYLSQTEAMLQLIRDLLAASDDVVCVVESDERFDFSLLPDADQWDVRAYAPAVVGMLRK